MTSMKQTRWKGEGDPPWRQTPAVRSTRRSWLAAFGGLLAAGAMSGGGAHVAPAASEDRPPRSVWPYQIPGTQFLLEARVTIAPVIDIGETSHGQRRIVPITGGSFHGPAFSGTILEEGEDIQLLRLDGVVEIAARYTLRTRDGVLVSVVNRGLIVPGAKPAVASTTPLPAYVRTIPSLEAPRNGRYEWLNRALYVGTLNPLPAAEHAVVVRFFKLT
jgi:Protein of unknown function (DUF3237)